VRETGEALRASIQAQRVQEQAQAAIKDQVEGKNRPPAGLTVLHPPQHQPARRGDCQESRRLVELHRMRRAPGTAALREAAEAPDGVSQRQRDREVVGAAREGEPAGPGHGGPRDRGAGQASEEHEPGVEIRPETQFAPGVVGPSKDDKQALGSGHGAHDHQPDGSPESVLGQAERRVVLPKPEQGDHHAGGGEDAERGHALRAAPAWAPA